MRKTPHPNPPPGLPGGGDKGDLSGSAAGLGGALGAFKAVTYATARGEMGGSWCGGCGSGVWLGVELMGVRRLIRMGRCMGWLALGMPCGAAGLGGAVGVGLRARRGGVLMRSRGVGLMGTPRVRWLRMTDAFTGGVLGLIGQNGDGDFREAFDGAEPASFFGVAE